NGSKGSRLRKAQSHPRKAQKTTTKPLENLAVAQGAGVSAQGTGVSAQGAGDRLQLHTNFPISSSTSNPLQTLNFSLIPKLKTFKLSFKVP
ncbi:hypothetical protein A2U01_0076704, partial [Trifolium medium]|nr:hypothetical protein [Trifolium medium]